MTNNHNKNYKLLPCIVYIQTGSCPYRERCQFKHPDGLKGITNSIIRKKNYEDNTKDLFYYPQIANGNIEEYKIMDTIDLNRLPIFVHLGYGKCIDTYKSTKLFIEEKKITLRERDIRASNMINSLINFIEDNKKIDRRNMDKKYLMKKEVYCSFFKNHKNNKIRENTNSPNSVAFIY